MFRPMKPETIERRRREHEQEQRERKAQLIADLRERVERDGPDSIWAELLVEQERAS